MLGVFCEAIADRLLQSFEVFMKKSLLLDEHNASWQESAAEGKFDGLNEIFSTL